MLDIQDLSFIQEAVSSCHYLWEAGWGECHAGNMSLLLNDTDLDALQSFLSATPVEVPFAYDTAGLVEKTFLLTRSGGQFRTITERVETDLGIIRVKQQSYEILWGFGQGQLRPTSELPAHLLCHAARLAANPDNRLVMHTHPTYLNAMTTIADLDEQTFTEALWSLNSECTLVFPDGIGLLPWMVCGEGPIGAATAHKMERFRLVVWPFHGIFSSGCTFDEAIGLIETVEKNAHIYVAVQGSPHHCITSAQLHELADHFGLQTAF